VLGAAAGTAVSIVFVTVVLGWGMVGRSYDGFGMAASPVPLTVGRPWFDRDLFHQVIEISIPLMSRRVAEHLVVFPLLWIAAVFGPTVVVALEVGRRVRGVLNSVRWGFSIAASTLVGQQLGGGDELEADRYASEIIRLSFVVYVTGAIVIGLLATPIASIFVTSQEAISATAAFVVVGAISSIGFGIDGAATGVLRGAGDTRWPFVATIVGRYVFALPVAALGVLTPLGVAGLYGALLVEAFVPGAITLWLVRLDRWKVTSRKYRPPAEVAEERG